mmetsp:Transcript_45881/g.120307  ORF Transcript_45881/g.120307 Transcript_45881/m.120307 type:complete len:352 (-) Transcript_45881:329-1384(-)
MAATSRARYSSGTIELAWNGVAQEQVCALAQRDAFSTATQHWLSFSSNESTYSYAGTENLRVPAKVAPLLSTFAWPIDEARPACTEVIEPLTGMARHPRAGNTGCWLRRAPMNVRQVRAQETSKYDIGHIVFASRCAIDANGCSTLAGRRFGMPQAAASSRQQQRLRRRNLLFDLLGCARYGAPMEKPTTMGGGIKPSLPLLEAIYRRSCIHFDGIWAWEASPMNPTTWWKRVPNATRRVLTFINRPVTAEEFLGTLEREATPGDFVVLKLDIDTPGLEDKVIHSVLGSRRLSSLIDELHYEYHVSLRLLGNSTAAKGLAAKLNMGPSTVDEALQTMRRLRARGIRSHFWV